MKVWKLYAKKQTQNPHAFKEISSAILLLIESVRDNTNPAVNCAIKRARKKKLKQKRSEIKRKIKA